MSAAGVPPSTRSASFPTLVPVSGVLRTTPPTTPVPTYRSLEPYTGTGDAPVTRPANATGSIRCPGSFAESQTYRITLRGGSDLMEASRRGTLSSSRYVTLNDGKADRSAARTDCAVRLSLLSV